MTEPLGQFTAANVYLLRLMARSTSSRLCDRSVGADRRLHTRKTGATAFATPPPTRFIYIYNYFFNPPQLISCGQGGGGGSPHQPGMAACIRLLLFYTKKQKQKPHNISAKNNTRIDQLGIVKDAKPNQTTTLLKALGVLEKKKEDSTMGPNRSVQRLRPFVAVNKGEWQRRDWWAVL